MSAKPRTTPKDLVLSVPLARQPGAKARGLPRTVPAVRIPLGFSAISKTCWRREGNWVQTFSGCKSMLYADTSIRRLEFPPLAPGIVPSWPPPADVSRTNGSSAYLHNPVSQ
jgi:hypothetical protein